MTRVLVTGASGFVGAALTPFLRDKGIHVRAVYRSIPTQPCAGVEAVRVDSLSSSTDWSAALAGIDTVIHLAGPAHGRTGFQEAIVDGAAALSRQARAAGVSRFVFVSSIKAVLDHTADEPVSEQHEPRPESAYGRAKLEAEQALMAESGLHSVILRPPLVFAAQAKGNFARLLRLADTAAPLPLQSVHNQRSLIALSDLTEALRRVVTTPSAPAGVFHLASGAPLSSAEIVASLRRGLERPANLFRNAALAALMPASLRQSLAVDDGRFREVYGSLESGDVRHALSACAAAWKRR